MKPETEQENQKQFVVYSDQNHEWNFNGKDTLKLSFKSNDCKETSNTIHWRGLTFHVKITHNLNYVIFKEKIHTTQFFRHTKFYAGYSVKKDIPPIIEAEKYFVEILPGPGYMTIVEKLKQEEKTIEIPEENTAEIKKENKRVTFKDVLKSIFSKEKQDVKQEEKQEDKIEEKVEENEDEKVSEIIPEPEDTLIRECPFVITKASEDIKYSYPEKRQETLNICTDKVTLYESKSGCINSYAYFEEKDFVVDSWKLGDAYEDEYFIIVDKRKVKLLYKEFNIKPKNKFKLLIGVLNAFNGKNCFKKYEEFLESKKIPYGGK